MPVYNHYPNCTCGWCRGGGGWGGGGSRTAYASLPSAGTRTTWDGVTTKKHPVTGEEIPDEFARRTVLKFVNPRRADWPSADFIIGNPPFIGNWKMRGDLGDGYTETLRSVYSEVPETAEFVMYWWHRAAEIVRAGKARRFGFITTNSLRQTFQRRVITPHLADPTTPGSLVFAIPDHPWVDSANGAAVRIAMTVARSGQREGAIASCRLRKAGGWGRGLKSGVFGTVWIDPFRFDYRTQHN